MGDTFGDLVRSVRLHVAMAPVFLVEDWVKGAFLRAWEYRGPSAWSFARRESAFNTNNQKSGLVSVVHGSKFVTVLSGITLAETDELRQFRAGQNQPVYSIECVDVSLNKIELDRPFTGATSASIAAIILDAYITMPADFSRFLAIIDPTNGAQPNFWITDTQLNVWDPQRSSTGMPWALATRRTATIAAIQDRFQYELWPYSTTFREYWYFYAIQAPELAEDDRLPGLFASRSDIIQAGALADAAMWPGTEDRKNPYFNVNIAKSQSEAFLADLARLEVKDEDIYPTWWERVSQIGRLNGAGPFDARFLQSHDFSYQSFT